MFTWGPQAIEIPPQRGCLCGLRGWMEIQRSPRTKNAILVPFSKERRKVSKFRDYHQSNHRKILPLGPQIEEKNQEKQKQSQSTMMATTTTTTRRFIPFQAFYNQIGVMNSQQRQTPRQNDRKMNRVIKVMQKNGLTCQMGSSRIEISTFEGKISPRIDGDGLDVETQNGII